jgi:MarR-like DNA-binding transcriptional regulator SgrR of sgrS sRNA
LKESVLKNDLYSRKAQHIKKFLILLENIGKKELLDYEKDLKKAEIEHIIPQNPAPGQWESITFEDREKYQHTLGNLTLTFDNQSLSNKAFEEKKQILIAKSRIKLNNELAQYDDFETETLKNRAIAMLNSFVSEFLIIDNY